MRRSLRRVFVFREVATPFTNLNNQGALAGIQQTGQADQMQPAMAQQQPGTTHPGACPYCGGTGRMPQTQPSAPTAGTGS